MPNAALGPADNPGHRLSHLDLPYRQPELAAPSDPRDGRIAPGHRARCGGPSRSLDDRSPSARPCSGDPSGLFQLSLAPGKHRAGGAVAGGLATRSAAIVQSQDYKGSARTPQDYIRESIVDPHAYVVPGPTFSAGGQSIMPPFGT